MKIKEMSFQEIMKLPQAERLFIKDLKWSLIWEKIKIGVPITLKDRDYFYNKLNET